MSILAPETYEEWREWLLMHMMAHYVVEHGAINDSRMRWDHDGRLVGGLADTWGKLWGHVKWA